MNSYLVPFLVCLFYSCSIFSQYFEGSAIYEITVSLNKESNQLSSSDQSIITGELQSLEGNLNLSIINGNYRFSSEGLYQDVIFNYEKNSLMVRKKGEGSYSNIDHSARYGRVNMIEFLRETDTILGIPCNGIVIYEEGQKIEVHYSDQYPINPKWFEDHKLFHLDIIARECGSLPLKIRVVKNDVIIDRTVVSLKSEFPDPEMFEIDPLSDVDSIYSLKSFVIKNLFKITMPEVLRLNQLYTDDISIIYENEDYGLSVSILDLEKNKVTWTSLEEFGLFMKENLYHYIDNCEFLSEEVDGVKSEISAKYMDFTGNHHNGDPRYYLIGVYETSTHFIGVVTESEQERRPDMDELLIKILQSVEEI